MDEDRKAPWDSYWLNFTDQEYYHRCRAINGDPLPDWKEFRADPSKQKQSDAWIAAAVAVI